MQSMLQANPDIVGVISGNDEMALGAIAALKEAGKLDQVKVGGFDGSPDAVAAVKAGEMQYTVLQPVAVFSAEAVQQADNFIKTGKTGAATRKAAVRLHPDHQGQCRQVHSSPSRSPSNRRREGRRRRRPLGYLAAAELACSSQGRQLPEVQRQETLS